MPLCRLGNVFTLFWVVNGISYFTCFSNNVQKSRAAKNGYYADLVQHVREAFEDDDLVRIDCKGLNTSDYKKIGAKLRVSLSFKIKC